jgi:prolyl oligopeptidase
LRNGLLDPLRHEASPGAGSRLAEFGTVALRADVSALLATDPYQNVRAGVTYPAMLLSAGSADPDVAFWHSAKMAARLQAVGTRAKGPILLRQEAAGDMPADGLAFLLWQLGVRGFQPREWRGSEGRVE